MTPPPCFSNNSNFPRFYKNHSPLGCSAEHPKKVKKNHLFSCGSALACYLSLVTKRNSPMTTIKPNTFTNLGIFRGIENDRAIFETESGSLSSIGLNAKMIGGGLILDNVKEISSQEWKVRKAARVASMQRHFDRLPSYVMD